MARGRRLIVANWKMNGYRSPGLDLACALAAKAAGAANNPAIVLCPPATLIALVGATLTGSPIMLGAQDCHTAEQGAFTGDLSAAMFADLGCRYVILGHSERRTLHGETDQLIAGKVAAAQAAGLTAIVCVGETLAERQTGTTAEVIARQVVASLPPACDRSKLVIAYEPIWAIGSGQQPTPAEVAVVHRSIRQALGAGGDMVPVIYGGSVAPANAAALFAEPEIDGALIGGASLKAESFWAIVEAGR